MTSKRELYLVPKTLDAQARILGLPLDEFVPSLGFALLFFVLNKVVLSILVPIAIVVGVRFLKQGQGSAWLMNLCHWYLPSNWMQQILRKTPASLHREYIA